MSSSTTSTCNISGSRLEASEAMCFHCFEVLLDDLEGDKQNGSTNTTSSSGFGWRPFRSGLTSSNGSSKRKPSSKSPSFAKELSDPSTKCPLFVTWDKKRPPKSGFPGNLLGSSPPPDEPPVYELRGCIGSLLPKPLLTAIGEYALTSALKDRRFHPITASEIPQLRVAVSLLVQYEPCQNYLDWTVGVHGIVIRLLDKETTREYSATYLPEVAKEQNWDQKQAVTALIRKAGYVRRIDQAVLDAISCTRYQSSKRRLTYDEYIKIKQQSQTHNHNTPKMRFLKTADAEAGISSPTSTQPSSASSSFQQGTDEEDVNNNDQEDDDANKNNDADENDRNMMLNHPPKQWNTCNNL